MRKLVGLWPLLLFWMSAGVIKCDDNVNSLITDVISKFRLKFPTVLYHGSAPELCFTNQWVLCLNLENEQTLIQKEKGITTSINYFCCRVAKSVLVISKFPSNLRKNQLNFTSVNKLFQPIFCREFT